MSGAIVPMLEDGGLHPPRIAGKTDFGSRHCFQSVRVPVTFCLVSGEFE